ncbi:hypothetical protein JYT91_00175 [archaeon AH-315-M20]|nr:hypothetical protein [archaeon AH-315-M20]
MRRKLSKKELKKKAKSTKEIIRGIINETINLPDNAIIFDPEILSEIFTRKRLELIQYINSCKPQSILELAELTGRKKQAVFRDLKLLERNELVKLVKKGKTVIPTVQRKMAILDLQKIFSLEVPKKTKKLDALVYVNQKNVNQAIEAK